VERSSDSLLILGRRLIGQEPRRCSSSTHGLWLARRRLWAIYVRARAAELVALGPDLIVVWANRDIAAGMGQVCDKAATDWIGYNNEYDRDGSRRFLQLEPTR
jgi:hypothetical protein